MITAARMPAAIRLSTRSRRSSPPSSASRPTAVIGIATLISWFQSPVTTTAAVTACVSNRQPRSIPYDTPMPTASPPGTALDSAVEVWVSTIDCR